MDTSKDTQAAVSRWFEVTQGRIDTFAEATEDAQFIHTDPVRAAQTPYGGTIAHGFLTLSLLSAMYVDAVPMPPGVTRSVNIGFDKVRFLSPVATGARVRGVFLQAAEDTSVPGRLSCIWSVRVEIEGRKKAALMGRWLTRSYLADTPHPGDPPRKDP